MALISLLHMVYYTLRFFLLQCYREMRVTFRLLEHSQKSHTKKKGSQRSSCQLSYTFCPDFVNLYNKPVA